MVPEILARFYWQNDTKSNCFQFGFHGNGLPVSQCKGKNTGKVKTNVCIVF